MTGREPCCGIDGRVRIVHLVVVFVAFLQPLQNARGLFDGRFLDWHFLQPPGEGAILLDVLELFECRRANHTEIAGDQHGLDERCQIHRAASGGTGAHGGVDLVDEEDRPVTLREGTDDGFEALFEITPETRSGKQGRAVERVDLSAFERRRHIGLEQPQREALGERRLAHARLADEHGIVLPTTAENLNCPLQLGLAPNQWIEMAGGRSFAEIDRVRAERIPRSRRWLLVFVSPARERCRRLTDRPPPAPWRSRAR